jgi:thiosulfate/3-mercaptopyruvate sulfurtransferase
MTTPVPAPPASPLISVAALAKLLSGPALLVVDCRFELSEPSRGRADYAAGHVPGAVYAHLDEQLSGPRTPATGRHPLPSPEAFAGTLGEWGLDPATRVVAYDQGGGAYASRLWWMLRARGHFHVQVLDGGMAAWRSAGQPVATSAPARRAMQVVPVAFAGVVDSQSVQSGLARGTLALVDARSADRFAGRNETLDPVAGRIPGALNHPFNGNLGADGLFLDATRLRDAWQATLAAAAGKPLVSMCGSGVTACHNLLALELMGRTGARLYAGSYSEWITDPARPVTTGAM